jgi:hypothetical protein
VIVVGSLARDVDPATWGVYLPTMWDWAFLLGTFGLFCSLMLVFARSLPIIPAFEMKRLFRELWLSSRDRPSLPPTPSLPISGREGELSRTGETP